MRTWLILTLLRQLPLDRVIDVVRDFLSEKIITTPDDGSSTKRLYAALKALDK